MKKFVYTSLLLANLMAFWNGALHASALTHFKDPDEHLEEDPKEANKRKRKKKQEWHLID